MKSTFSPNQMRLIGKAWEVRHLLRVLVNQTKDSHVPLAELLQKRQPQQPAARAREALPTERSDAKREGRVIPFPTS